MNWALLAALWLASRPARRGPIRCWSRRGGRRTSGLRHDFAAMVGTGAAVMVHLPGAEPSSALRPTQAAELLRAFADGTRELEVTVLVARNVDPDRAYVEAQRVYPAARHRPAPDPGALFRLPARPRRATVWWKSGPSPEGKGSLASRTAPRLRFKSCSELT